MGHRNWGQKGMALYSISPCLCALQHVHRQSEHPFLLFYFVTVLLSCDGAHVLFRPICKSALMHQVALLLTRQLFSLSLWCCWMAGRTDICMPVWQLVKTINVQLQPESLQLGESGHQGRKIFSFWSTQAWSTQPCQSKLMLSVPCFPTSCWGQEVTWCLCVAEAGKVLHCKVLTGFCIAEQRLIDIVSGEQLRVELYDKSGTVAGSTAMVVKTGGYWIESLPLIIITAKAAWLSSLWYKFFQVCNLLRCCTANGKGGCGSCPTRSCYRDMMPWLFRSPAIAVSLCLRCILQWQLTSTHTG